MTNYVVCPECGYKFCKACNGSIIKYIDRNDDRNQGRKGSYSKGNKR